MPFKCKSSSGNNQETEVETGIYTVYKILFIFLRIINSKYIDRTEKKSKGFKTKCDEKEKRYYY